MSRARAGQERRAAGREGRPTKVDTKMFYAKLGFENIKKNSQTYIPYLLTCMGTVMMYYIIQSLAGNESLSAIQGGETIKTMLGLGTWIIGIFAVIFLFYTNSFLIKRRKKEFGLYNILGMEKRHLGMVVLWESLYAYLASMLAGLASGVLFSELVFLLAERVLRLKTHLQFEIIPGAMGKACVLFGVIFLVNLLNTLRQIHLSNPSELLRGGNVGEKEPKTRWLLALLGAATLGAGYYMAAVIEDPVEAMAFFFVAVVLVIIGTYCLFTAGSIVILKLMRRSKRFYYKANHFISVSGMMYRMKQNAAGLASICVLSTGVLIIISTTICMYLGTEASIRVRYPRNIYVEVQDREEGTTEKIKAMVEEVLAPYGAKEVDPLEYRYIYWMGRQKENRFSAFGDGSNGDSCVVQFLTLEDYNRLAGREETLEKDQVLLYTEKGKTEGTTLWLGENSYRIKERLADFPLPEEGLGSMVKSYYLVIPEKDTVKELGAGLGYWSGEEEPTDFWTYWYSFDLELTDEQQIEIWEQLSGKFFASALGEYGSVRGAAEARSSFYALNGGLLFLGIFLGFLFLMGTVLIIYYKQISEGYDDRERYQIMRKVGMSRREVKSSIRSQVLTVFYMPLLAAGCHIVFAFNMIRRILYMMGLFDTGFFALCTAGTLLIFAAFYCLVYGRTAKAYYKIIS